MRVSLTVTIYFNIECTQILPNSIQRSICQNYCQCWNRVKGRHISGISTEKKANVLSDPVVAILDVHENKVSADAKATVILGDTSMANTEGSDNKEVMGSNPDHTLGGTQDSKLYIVQEKCRQQIGEQFGSIPLDKLVTYEGPDIHWEYITDILQAHKLIRDSGIPNVLGMRIPVKTNLNVSIWKSTYPIIMINRYRTSYNLVFLWILIGISTYVALIEIMHSLWNMIPMWISIFRKSLNMVQVWAPSTIHQFCFMSRLS